jgi:hypothetical protein
VYTSRRHGWITAASICSRLLWTEHSSADRSQRRVLCGYVQEIRIEPPRRDSRAPATALLANELKGLTRK